MADGAFVVVKESWLLRAQPHPKRLSRQHLCPIGVLPPRLTESCNLLVKFRGRGGRIEVDDRAKIAMLKESPFIKSKILCEHLQKNVQPRTYVAFYFEGTSSEARCIVQMWKNNFFDSLREADPTLRLDLFDLPPRDATGANSPRIRLALYRQASNSDRELFAVHSTSFLEAPHIITPLFSHVLSLRSEDNINFPIVVKKIAEQLRALLLEGKGSVAIRKIERAHKEFWPEVADRKIAFLDGGVARIPGLANLEPLAMRVGVYRVTPGDRNLAEREHWYLKPYVIADIMERGAITAFTDRKRIQEAARYVLEPLTALSYLQRYADLEAFVIHGPIANQFLMYDEGEPNHIGRLSGDFLRAHNILEADVMSEVGDIPSDSEGPLWNQFMAIYALILRRIHHHPTAIVGVVERALGRPVATALLKCLRKEKIVNQAYVDRLEGEMAQYDIGDDFLFGCMLREGEYLTPLTIQKNPPRRARPRWQPVVTNYPQPKATVLKAEEVKFPFRMELNDQSARQADRLVGLIYHMARLLPRYSFPVGLDIVDKYAKVPDWIARGISAELSASVLRRALKTGDPQLVTQVRELLARGSKGFFFRPNT